MYIRAKMIFGKFYFAEKDLFSHMETTAQRYLWLYHHAIVKGIPIVSPSYMYTQKRTKECFSVSARRGMFCPYCAWGGKFLGLASFWCTDNRQLGSQHLLRHVAWFIAPSTLAIERLSHCASACLCLKYIPSFRIKWLWIACVWAIRKWLTAFSSMREVLQALSIRLVQSWRIHVLKFCNFQ